MYVNFFKGSVVSWLLAPTGQRLYVLVFLPQHTSGSPQCAEVAADTWSSYIMKRKSYDVSICLYFILYWKTGLHRRLSDVYKQREGWL